MVQAQGGDPKHVEQPELLEVAGSTTAFRASRTGVLDCVDSSAVGLALAALGGARTASRAGIDHAVGIRWLVEFGSEVQAGDDLALLYHREGAGLEQAQALLERAVAYDTGRPQEDLILRRLDP